MSSEDELKRLAQLVNFSFDKDFLRTSIRSFRKTPKMYGVASILKANGIKLVDDDGLIKLETSSGKIEIPKDGFTDGYRLQEAVVDNTSGGKGLICLPAIKGVMDSHSPADKWVFKEAWDRRERGIATAVWGGDFQTYVDDHLEPEGDEFVKIDIGTYPHYYNVVLSNRDQKFFSMKNPDFEVISCDGPCMKRAHKHAVHGEYVGAVVGGYPCAPPFSMHPVWNKLPRFDPQNVQAVEMAVSRADKLLRPLVAKKVEDKESDDKMDVINREVKCGAAETLRNFIDSPDSNWNKILECYRDPKTAKWAAPAQVSTSTSNQKKIKRRWNAAFEENILPLLKGDGSPLKVVLEAVWGYDKGDNKLVASYFMRRLVEGGTKVVENSDGNIFIDATD